GFKALFERTEFAKDIGAKYRGGQRCRGDLALAVEGRPVGHARACAPRGGPARGEVECAIERACRAEDLSRGESSARGHQALQVVRCELDIAVQDGDPFAARLTDSPVHGRRESRVAAHRDHTRATRTRQVGGAIRGGVIDRQHLARAEGLRIQRVEQTPQIFPTVPHGHDGGDHRRKRFFKRNMIFCNPSRHRLSFVSPSREEYRMEISPKRTRGFRIASILISSLNAMPSLISFMSLRMDLRNTHMPDCESRTQRKKRTDITRDSTRFPNLFLKL